MSDARSLESCWESLGILAEAALQIQGPIQFCELNFGDEVSISINGPCEHGGPLRAVIEVVPGSYRGDPGGARFGLGGWLELERQSEGELSEALLDLIGRYGAVALATVRARALGRAVAFGHLAQSLDGRIATVGGDAHWIGGEANRTHAHRMRALCAGVMIGAGTLRRDKSRLNVRHVQGQDPVRIVLGAGPHDLTSLREASKAPIWLFGGRAQGAETIAGAADKWQAPEAVLTALFERGVHSVYVEGGSRTLSHFIKARCLDVIQIHTAPMILGSGVPGLDFGGVGTIKEALRFEKSAFVPVGEGMMFVGRPKWGSDD